MLVAAALLFGYAHASTPVTPSLLNSVVPQRQEPLTRASILVGKVIKVVDGDTIVVVDRTRRAYRIRLKGIDAPEKSQAFGIESTRSLVHLVSGREVIVEWTKVDRWNRLVGRVLMDKQDVCLQQIRAGMAWHFEDNEQSDRDRELYDLFQNEAQLARRGLWADSAPLEPWVVRDRQRETVVKTYVYRPSPITVSPAPAPVNGAVRGNRRSGIYHWPGCPNYNDIAMHNRVPFNSPAEAERAGFRAARNCH